MPLKLLGMNCVKITVIQAYAPRTDYDDNDSEHFYDQLQEVVDQTPKKDIIVVWGDWSAKIEDACKNWKGICDQNCKPETNKRGLRLLEYSSYNNLKVVNTLGSHKPSRCWAWHNPGENLNPINYVMVKQCFQSGVNIAKTRKDWSHRLRKSSKKIRQVSEEERAQQGKISTLEYSVKSTCNTSKSFATSS